MSIDRRPEYVCDNYDSCVSPTEIKRVRSATVPPGWTTLTVMGGPDASFCTVLDAFAASWALMSPEQKVIATAWFTEQTA